MCATFTDDDVDKPVENSNGETVGVVAAVEGDVVHVRPDPTVVDSVKSSLGWEKGAAEIVAFDRKSIREITDDAVLLEGSFPIRDEPTADASADRGESSEGTPETNPADETKRSDADSDDE
ncbi:hypothetical protein [Natrinema salaciae]|uniref:PRC-barrel domain-containing protein n=1 Tax=Natrinema salaciae TaxID=1186196 RepID=A0A1H8ZFT0_9EURY|nr:hypothetical protein [Natrinema salaciae]SEP63242.1 hypothetical protein SAMN04489841_0159 [Natrinema salaciae]